MAKSEHEKLLAGENYDYRDPEIQALQRRCRQLVAQLNAATEPAERTAIIHDLLGRAGDRVTINGSFTVNYGSHISVGDDVFINGNCTFQDSNRITLGDRVIIAPDTKFYCGAHSLDARQRFGTRADGSRYLVTNTKPITVGNDVWIGGNVTVIGGVTIGNNVIVGAGAVVVKDVPDNSVVGGVPARVLKTLPALDKVNEEDEIQ